MAKPSYILTPQVDFYQKKKYGWLICYGMNTFYGHFWSVRNTGSAPPASTMFNTANVDVESWAIKAKEAGVQYAALTVQNEYGFCLWSSNVSFSNVPQVSINGRIFPPNQNPYCVQSGIADLNITQKFVDEFRARNIEPVAYVNVSDNKFMCDGPIYRFGNSVQTDAYVQYLCNICVELIELYGFKYIWLDAYDSNVGIGMQRIYDAIKVADPECQVIGNVVGETNFSRYPYDLQSTEEYIAYNNPSIISSNYRTYNGETFYVGQELVGTPYYQMSQWYDYDENVIVQPTVSPINGAPYVKLLEDNPTNFQNLVNNARLNERSFLAGVLVKRNGDLLQSNLDFLTSKNFGIGKSSAIISQLL